MSRISTEIHHTVILGEHRYRSPLSVAVSGVILPQTSNSSADAVYSSSIGVALNNAGTIIGGGCYPDSQARGGAGVDLTAGGTVRNFGTIDGGEGAWSYGSPGSFNYRAGYGGTGVDLTFGMLLNDGAIAGGAGGGGSGSPAGGGAGVGLYGGAMRNAGTVTGGAGGGSTDGGIGLVASSGASISNVGTVMGGQGGGISDGPYPTGTGGTGIYLRASTLVNRGFVEGGLAGVISKDGTGGDGGNGIEVLAGAGVTNFGVISAGAGGINDLVFYTYQGTGSTGGTGADLSGGTLRNEGIVSGGAGGAGTHVGFAGGNGGAGVDVGSAILTNSGTIRGGAGGIGDQAESGSGGAGVFAAGGTVVNTGLIQGGNYAGAGHYDKYPNSAGAGVYLGGGTLTTSGTIIGGRAPNDSLAAGDAVQFGQFAATLVVDPGAAFVGQVSSNPIVADTLQLAGTGGTLSGLGSQFTGFALIDESAHATWTLTGASTVAAGTDLVASQGALLNAAEIGGTGTLIIDRGATIGVSAGPVATAIHFRIGGGTLSLGADATASGAISGFGSGDVIDIGRVLTSLTYLGGTLTLEDGITAVETLTLAGGYTSANFTLSADQHGGTDILFVQDISAASDNPRATTPLSLTIQNETRDASPNFFLGVGHFHINL